MKLRHLLAQGLALVTAGCCFALGCADIIGVDFGEKQAPSVEGGLGGGGSGGTGGIIECNGDPDCVDDCPETICKCVNNQCVAECQTTAECIGKYGKSDPHACIEGTCRQLVTTDCAHIYPATGWEQENAIFLGVMEDRSSPEWAADVTEYYLESIKLAQNQIEKAIVGPGPVGSQRSLVLLLCDEMLDSERAAKHVIEDIRAPVLFGPAKPEHQNTVVESVLGNPSNNAIMMTRLAFNEVLQTPKAYSLTPSATLRSLALQELMKAEEPALRTRLGKSASDPLQVALLTVDDIGYAKLNDLIQKDVTIGGKPLEQLPLNTEFKIVTVHNLNGCGGDGGPACEYGAKTTELLDFHPAVIIVNGPEKLFGTVLKSLERQWETIACKGDAGTPQWTMADRPFYLSAFWDYTETTLQQNGVDGCAINTLPKEIQLTERARSVDVFPQDFPGDAGDLEGAARYKKFLTEFKTATGSNFSGQDAGMGLAYDSFFVVAYAISAILKDDPLKSFTGNDVANAFATLVQLDGTSLGTGSGDIKTIRDKLNAGDAINLQGIFSRLLFDPGKHSPVYDYAVMCANADLFGTGLPGKASGQTFNTSTGLLVGDFQCF